MYKNTMLYSFETKGFYDLSFKYENLPEDAVEIPKNLYFLLIDGMYQGKEIVKGGDGIPTLRDKISSIEEMSSAERVWRNSELVRSDIELNKVQDGDVKASGSVSEWRSYRKALRMWPESSNFPEKTARPKSPDYKE